MKRFIKDCPFCGSDARLEHNMDMSYIYCTKCHIRTEGYKYAPDHSSDDDAVNAWNKRAYEE